MRLCFLSLLVAITTAALPHAAQADTHTCPHGYTSGLYCGDYPGTPDGLSEGILYSCSAGTYAPVTDCASHGKVCVSAEQGVDDYCATRCPFADGALYCGSGYKVPAAYYGLRPDKLYRCNDGVYALSNDCPANFGGSTSFGICVKNGNRYMDDFCDDPPTMAPVETPEPVEAPTPAPIEPVEPTPAPVEPTPAPVEPTPAPVTPAAPAPVDPTTPAPEAGGSTDCGDDCLFDDSSTTGDGDGGNSSSSSNSSPPSSPTAAVANYTTLTSNGCGSKVTGSTPTTVTYYAEIVHSTSDGLITAVVESYLDENSYKAAGLCDASAVISPRGTRIWSGRGLEGDAGAELIGIEQCGNATLMPNEPCSSLIIADTTADGAANNATDAGAGGADGEECNRYSGQLCCHCDAGDSDTSCVQACLSKVRAGFGILSDMLNDTAVGGLNDTTSNGTDSSGSGSVGIVGVAFLGGDVSSVETGGSDVTTTLGDGGSGSTGGTAGLVRQRGDDSQPTNDGLTPMGIGIVAAVVIGTVLVAALAIRRKTDSSSRGVGLVKNADVHSEGVTTGEEGKSVASDLPLSHVVGEDDSLFFSDGEELVLDERDGRATVVAQLGVADVAARRATSWGGGAGRGSKGDKGKCAGCVSEDCRACRERRRREQPKFISVDDTGVDLGVDLSADYSLDRSESNASSQASGHRSYRMDDTIDF